LAAGWNPIWTTSIKDNLRYLFGRIFQNSYKVSMTK
jgi:hypothetical protein